MPNGTSISAVSETVQPHGDLQLFLGDDGTVYFRAAAPNANPGVIRQELLGMRQTLQARIDAIDSMLEDGRTFKDLRKNSRDVQRSTPGRP